MENAGDLSSRAKRTWAERALTPGLLSIVTLAAFVLRLDRLGNQSLWVDEAMSVVFAAKPLPELFHLLVTEDIHPPLYPLLLHFWMAVAGSGEVAVRFPSLVFGVCLVPLLYLTGRRLELMADPKERPPISLVGLAGAVIAATSTFYVGYSQEARNYMAVTFMGLLSSYLLLRALARARKRDWAAYAVATAGALYTHYTAFLLLPFHLLFLVLTWRSGGGAWRGWGLSLAGVGVAYLPWLGYSAGQLQRISDYWPGTLQLDAALRTTLLLFVAGGGAGPYPVVVPMVAGLALLAVGLAALLLGGVRGRSSRHILFLLLYLLVPSVLLFAVAYYRPKFDPRYLLLVTPAFYLTLAWGIGWLLRAALFGRASLAPRVLLACLGSAALVGAVAVSVVYGEPTKLMHVGDGRTGIQEYGDYRGLVAYLEGRAEPGDGVVLMMNSYHPFVYYSRLQMPWYPMEPFDDFDGAIIRLNRMAEKHQRLWFILWQRQWADPADYVMHVMETQAREVPLDASFGGIGLRLFELIPGQRFSYYPRVDRKAEGLFGERLLEFWGWNVSADRVAAGGTVEFDLHWRPMRRAEGQPKLKTKVMLADADRHLWAVVDEMMVSPFYPPNQWKVREILHDRHRLAVPAGVPPGSYEVLLIAYDENTMKDLPIERWSGESLGTILSLGTMEVTPTPESAFPPADRQPLATWHLAGGRVELLRSRISRTSTRPDERTEVELLWRAPETPAAAYSLRLALLDEKGRPTGEQSFPLARGYPTDRWRPGEPVLSRHWLSVPADLPAGRYGVAVAVAGAHEMEVSSLHYAQLSTLEVRKPTQPPGPDAGRERVDPLP